MKTMKTILVVAICMFVGFVIGSVFVGKPAQVEAETSSTVKYELKIEEIQERNTELEFELTELESQVYNMMEGEAYEITIHQGSKTIKYTHDGKWYHTGLVEEFGGYGEEES